MRPGLPALMAILLGLSAAARGDEALILLDDQPRDLSRFTVAPDGSRLYFASSRFVVFDASGRLINRIGAPQNAAPRDLIPLPDGRFLSCTSYAGGHLAICRPDGTEERVLVAKGGAEDVLRNDGTGWTSPNAAAVDPGRRLVFALDCTQGAQGQPDPAWSRIAVFDLDGKYLRDINRYDAADPKADDARRTWYDDLEVDPARKRIYVVARRTQQLVAFTYDGDLVGRVAAPYGGGLAVFPDGRIAVGAAQVVQVFSPDLKPLRTLNLARTTPNGNVADLESDAAGRLYASVSDPSITFLRWGPDLNNVEVVRPRYLKVEVDFPAAAVPSGKTLVMKARASGSPAPRLDAWQVAVRPADGSDLRWRTLTAVAKDGVLGAAVPRGLRGPYEVSVRLGEGPPDRAGEPSLRKTVTFIPTSATRSVAVIPESGRTAYRRGEPIPVRVARRSPRLEPISVRLDLRQGPREIATATVPITQGGSYSLPAAVTRALPPGHYALAPSAVGHEGYPFEIDIAPDRPDSPLQRINYQGFGEGAASHRPEIPDTPDRLAYVRDHARALAALGFSRETDRRASSIPKDGPLAWRRDKSPFDLKPDALPPPDYYAVPQQGDDWEPEAYLDAFTRYGLSYDTQLLPHCSGVKFRDARLADWTPTLQRTLQWFGRYPSFYGVNYNDEMFFGTFASEWSAEDEDWLRRTAAERFPGQPPAAVRKYALGLMYDRLNAAAHLANPRARLTATPMWQFPAVDGSYAPTIFRGLDESYTHFVSEGFDVPWYAAHSVEMLRRPGLPVMGVFDNAHRDERGDLYMKRLAQVVARGVQGVGAQMSAPHSDPLGADGYRVANHLARWYGPVFAEAPPLNEAAVLYSYTQDVTESRNVYGTPHWERVYALFGAGLMAGVPMSILYEEDLADGHLLDPDGKPRVPMLFLVGQTQPLPDKARRAIDAFLAAGGKLFTDADSADHPRATRLPLRTHTLKPALQEGFASDSAYPLLFPHFEALARDLAAAVGSLRRFPVDTDDPWTSKNAFDGGAIRYVMLAAETRPFPWDAGLAWSLRAQFDNASLPRNVRVTLPDAPGVIYDAFDRTLLAPRPGPNGTRTLTADLTTFPGRLLAIAPRKLGPPRVSAGLTPDGSTLHYRVAALTDDAQPLPARVPLRIRLSRNGVASDDLARGTNALGTLDGTLTLPTGGGDWTLEVTELLGGSSSVLPVPSAPSVGPLLSPLPDAELFRGPQILALLQSSGGKVRLATTSPDDLPPARRSALAAALARHKVALNADADTSSPHPGLTLALGTLDALAKRPEPPTDLLGLALRRGLFPLALTPTIPGPGRGLITPLYAPRADAEHAIAVLGADPAGLARALDALLAYLDRPTSPPDPETSAPPALDLASRPAAIPAPLPPLRDLVGAKLASVTPGTDGVHLLVTADGYLRNLALVADRGNSAEVVRAERAGQAHAVVGPYLGADARTFGATARDITRTGEAFHLVDARTGDHDVFPNLGDHGRLTHRHAASPDGKTVVAAGTHGVLCWKRSEKGAWAESWALDFWKTYGRLDWPISPTAERIPQFHALIPQNPDADHVLVLYGETSDTGWITPDNPASASLASLRLADGKPRWRFDVPVPATLLFPELFTSPDGSRIALRVQMGSFGKESYRTFALEEGRLLGTWDNPTKPLATALADRTGRVAVASLNRLLEVRRPDGTLALSRTWRDQPISLAFAPDGLTLDVADDSGRITRLDPSGRPLWSLDLGTNSALATRSSKLYAAGTDGRLRALDPSGRLLWTLDLTPALADADADPMATPLAAAETPAPRLHLPNRPPTTSGSVPDGPNLLRDPAKPATLTVGGTPGYGSDGTVLIKPELLTNGRLDDPDSTWLNTEELFWDSTAGRQPWAEITFKSPTDLHALTVHEHPAHPESFPTSALIQTWDPALNKWTTAARGDFLNGPTNTYTIPLKAVTRLRYVPLTNLFRNPHTTEIEVR